VPNPLLAVHAQGQSIWLDYIDRTILRDGTLARLIRDDALMGMTSNPTIFEKALAEGHAYDEQIAAAAEGERTAWELFELIEADDVRAACDLFAPVYESTNGGDGFVSIEVSPSVGHDTEGTVLEARRLWRAVDRPNVLVKVPGTIEGAAAIRRLIAEGISVNVTLLFSIAAHARVIESYIGGLEERAGAGQPIDRIASVASFFVSRVDTEVDRRLDAIGAPAELRGQAAIANAKRAYRLYQEQFSGARWAALADRGARVQRPLWASTSTKNPAYRDVMYVEALIGPDTVNTLPPATIEAFRDHGKVARTVDADLDAADAVMEELERLGISYAEVTDKLLRDGVASFAKSFDSLIAGLERKTASLGRVLAPSR
jgi:transaldolase